MKKIVTRKQILKTGNIQILKIVYFDSKENAFGNQCILNTNSKEILYESKYKITKFLLT